MPLGSFAAWDTTNGNCKLHSGQPKRAPWATLAASFFASRRISLNDSIARSITDIDFQVSGLTNAPRAFPRSQPLRPNLGVDPMTS